MYVYIYISGQIRHRSTDLALGGASAAATAARRVTIYRERHCVSLSIYICVFVYTWG